MDKNERLVVIGILLIVTAFVGFDLITDFSEGVQVSHLLIEGTIASSAIFGIFYVLRGSVFMKHQLRDTLSENENLKREAWIWKGEAQKHIDGLAKSIDLQLNKWSLSGAEKEVALLLLKGLSLKEIAEIRKTTEKTARVQSIAIYSKAGLAGRSELAAFFLEDLLQPQSKHKDSQLGL